VCSLSDALALASVRPRHVQRVQGGGSVEQYKAIIATMNLAAEPEPASAAATRTTTTTTTTTTPAAVPVLPAPPLGPAGADATV
jgi:hypothetical protein